MVQKSHKFQLQPT